jgi:hypothetical protein
MMRGATACMSSSSTLRRADGRSQCGAVRLHCGRPVAIAVTLRLISELKRSVFEVPQHCWESNYAARQGDSVTDCRATDIRDFSFSGHSPTPRFAYGLSVHLVPAANQRFCDFYERWGTPSGPARSVTSVLVCARLSC